MPKRLFARFIVSVFVAIAVVLPSASAYAQDIALTYGGTKTPLATDITLSNVDKSIYNSMNDYHIPNYIATAPVTISGLAQWYEYGDTARSNPRPMTVSVYQFDDAPQYLRYVNAKYDIDNTIQYNAWSHFNGETFSRVYKTSDGEFTLTNLEMDLLFERLSIFTEIGKLPESDSIMLDSGIYLIKVSNTSSYKEPGDSRDCRSFLILVKDHAPKEIPSNTPSTPSTSGTSTISNEVTITLNGKAIAAEPPPVIENNYTLVPIRTISENLGLHVEWKLDERTVYIGAEREIVLPIDSDKALVNGEEVSLNPGAKIIDGRTYVPLRFISDAFHISVTWDAETRTVILLQ